MTKKRIIAEDAPVNELLGKMTPAPEHTLEATEGPGAPQRLTIPEGYKLDPRFIETKTKRLQLVLKPSVADKLKKYCKKNKVSVNEYVGNLLEETLKEF